MRLQSGCALIVAVAGTAVPFAMVQRAQADLPATLIAAWHDTTSASTGVLNAVPGLPAATLAAASANGLTVTWNNPTAANGIGSGSQGISTSNGTPTIDANGNVMFYGMIGLASYTTFDPITFLPVTNYLTGNAVVVSATVPTNFTNNQALFMAAPAGGYAFNNISIVARDGSTAAPATSLGNTDNLLGGSSVAPITGIPANSTLNGTGSVANGNTKGMGTGYAMSAGGKILFSSNVSPLNGPSTPTGNVAGTTFGATYFTGTSTGFAGSSSVTNTGNAGGVTGGTFTTATQNSSNIGTVNDAGQFTYVGTLAANASVSPAIDSTNNGGLWIGSSGGSSLIFRKGAAAAGPVTSSGTGTPAFGATTVSNTRINSSSSVLFSNTLGTGAAAPTGFAGTYGAANSNQTATVWYNGAGGSPQFIAQGGTAVPASAGLPSGVNYANSFLMSQQSLNNSNQALFFSKLNASTAANFPSAPGLVTTNVNDQTIMGWNPSTGATTTMIRTGVTPVPASTGIASATTYSDLGASNTQGIRLNNQGHFTFAASLTHDVGGTITSGVAGTSRANDAALFLSDTANPGSATLIARAGDACPGLADTYFGNLMVAAAINSRDTILFSTSVVDSLGNGLKVGIFSITDWFAWTPADGLFLVASANNTTYLGNNYVLSPSPISVNGNSNGSGGTMCLNDSDMLTFNALSSGGATFATQNTGIMVTQLPAPGAGALGLAGLAMGLRRRRR